MSRNQKEKDFDTKSNVKATNRSKGGKRNRGNRRSSTEATLNKGFRDNDPNWYFSTAELADQSTQLSFQNIAGYSTPLDTDPANILRIDTVMNPTCTYNVPNARSNAIESLEGHATIASSFWNDKNITPGKAGINLMAAKLYTLLSSFTGRTAAYACQDVAMLILAIAAIAEQVETIRRAFGLALTYNFRNRSMPLGLIKTMGIDPQDLADNLSIYRMRFNVALARINQIPLLENIAFIKKSRDVYQHVYLDSNSAMAQIFYYMPHYYYWLDEQGDDNGSILRAESFVETAITENRTMDTWLSHLEQSITAVLESSTLNFIYADMLNMANKLSVKTWQFEFLAENYAVTPEYNANALLQMHNLTVIGNPKSLTGGKVKLSGTGSMDVYITSGANVYCDADKNNILYNPIFESYSNVYSIPKWVVDMPTDQPTVEDRIEAMRYTSLSSGWYVTSDNTSEVSDGDAYMVFMAIPDHYVARLYLYRTYNQNSSYTDRLTQDGSAYLMGSGDGVSFALLSSQIEHAPMFRLSAPGVVNSHYIAGDLEYYTEIDYDYIRRVNDIMTVGLFDFRV